MNPHLQRILNFIQQIESSVDEERLAVLKAIKDVDKEIEITLFKLNRTEKVKRTTAILLEETIEELEQKRKAIEETNAALTKSLSELKAAQAQLIQSEKMASLGELTAGIAHEIQNPLNFVNNFSEVSAELLDEMKEELAIGNKQQAIEIAEDIKQNLEKILHHGQRADAIVKGMLQHSRTSSGVKEPTDINVLAEEYLRLAYHGFRAKDKSFNVTMNTDFDPNIGLISMVPQDIGRVILNLITNAFYVLSAKASATADGVSAPNLSTPLPPGGGTPSAPKSPKGDFLYQPTVTVTTKRKSPSGGLGAGGGIEIRVSDNGPGIPDSIKDKIFQPFFTTKPTGQGTGLGLSLSYDIIKAHGGEINVVSSPGNGTEFIIILPQDNTPEASKPNS